MARLSILLADGHRCIAPDLPGFGRSDKPTDLDWYSYDRHVEATTFVLDELGVRDATFVVGDRFPVEPGRHRARFADDRGARQVVSVRAGVVARALLPAAAEAERELLDLLRYRQQRFGVDVLDRHRGVDELT